MVADIVIAFFVIMAILVVWSVVGTVFCALLTGIFKDDSPKYGTEAERRFYSTRR